MEYLIELIRRLTNNEASIEWIVSVIIGISFTILVCAIFIMFYHFVNPVHRRMEGIVGNKRKQSVGRMKPVISILGPVASALFLKKSTKELSKVRRKLIHSGYDEDDAPLIYYSSKVALAIVFTSLTLLVATFYPKFSAQQVLFAALGMGFLGLVLPDYFLRHKLNKRQTAIRNAFPDALDLMVTCTEAGLGLNQTIQRVGEEIQTSHPALSKEFIIVNAKIRAGVDRSSALRDLAERTGLDDIRGMVTLLNQSITFGTSISDMLRVFSEEFRDKRMQKAEETAAKVGTKLLFPLVLCMFPAFFLVAIGPAVVRVLIVFGRV